MSKIKYYYADSLATAREDECQFKVAEYKDYKRLEDFLIDLAKNSDVNQRIKIQEVLNA